MSDYITREALAGVVGADDNRDQIKLDAARSAASRQVEHHCGRRFWQDSSGSPREFYASTHTCLDLLEQPGSQPKVEIAAGDQPVTVEIDSAGDGTFATMLESTDFLLLPRTAAPDGTAWSELLAVNNGYFPILHNGRPGVKITTQFGWVSVPDEVVQATMLQAVYLFKSKDAPLGIAQFGPEGAGMRLSNAPLHRAAAGLLAGLQRPPIG